ncbi:MAG: NHL repeat-containing protein [Nannocystales bacterium]
MTDEAGAMHPGATSESSGRLVRVDRNAYAVTVDIDEAPAGWRFASCRLLLGLLLSSGGCTPGTTTDGGQGGTGATATSSGTAQAVSTEAGDEGTAGASTIDTIHGSTLTGTTSTGPDEGDAESTEETGGPPLRRVPLLVGVWGELGTEPGQFVEPSSVELDADGNVYVASHEDRLQKFTADGALLEIFGEAGPGEGQFNHPHGLAMDRAQGLLYAGDQENNRVQVLTTQGEFVRLWTSPQFQHIHDVGIDLLSGNIYVGDLESNVVQKFSDTGEFILEFGGPGSEAGQFSGVWGMSTDSAGHVYVADSGNGRVQVFSSGGVIVGEWPGFAKPTGVFVDAQNRIYVCDSLADAVVIFDVTGVLLETWELPRIVGSASEPEDIVITADGTHIYLGDVLNHRVIHLTRREIAVDGG